MNHRYKSKAGFPLVGRLSFILLAFGTLVSRVKASSGANYTANAETAAKLLYEELYNPKTGLWKGIYWWQSANTLTTLIDLASVDSNVIAKTTPILSNTLKNAPKEFPKFLNEYYDDEGWWALAWIGAYDLTGSREYLNTAAMIFDDMTTGWGSPCEGLWWSKNRTGVNAIENELFLSVAASLANRIPNNSSYYLRWAQKEWNFFESSGMINSKSLINDGLVLSTCKNNGATVWTYNQGVILGALVEYHKASPNSSLIKIANDIAHAAIKSLTDSNGVLQEPCDPHCDLTAAQFKGVFARNLRILYMQSPKKAYKTFFEINANSIWAHDRKGNRLGAAWSGPFKEASFNATTQSAALDVLVGAIVVTSSDSTPSTDTFTPTSTNIVTNTVTVTASASPDSTSQTSIINSLVGIGISLEQVLVTLILLGQVICQGFISWFPIFHNTILNGI